jgi:peptidoglycan/LPS O-acetylase OafA/YrhL
MRALVVGPIIVVVAWMLTNAVGALSAAIGVLIVVANFLIAGWLLSKAATVSMQTYHAVALFGFFLRMGFIALSMFAVAWIFEVDRRAMGIAAITAFLGLLVLESLATLRGERKDLEWN